MTEADKIVAAIFAASMCAGKQDHAIYLKTYDEFLNKMKGREEAKKKKTQMTAVSKGTLEKAKRLPPRRPVR
jgi:hypothetical protein